MQIHACAGFCGMSYQPVADEGRAGAISETRCVTRSRFGATVDSQIDGWAIKRVQLIALDPKSLVSYSIPDQIE